MKILTKQWLDEVKKDETSKSINENSQSDNEDVELAASTKLKKPSKASPASAQAKKVSDNKTYHQLNSKAISSVMLESTDEEAGSEEEQMIIDQSKFSLTTNL